MHPPNKNFVGLHQMCLSSWAYLLYNSAQSLPFNSPYHLSPYQFFPGRVGVAGAWEYPRRATDRPGTLWGLGNFRIWFSGHGFQDLGSQLWDLNFHTHGFQDRNLKTFKTWFSGCGISILGPGFHSGASQWPSATGTHKWHMNWGHGAFPSPKNW
jgi:hypothetical protein